VVNEKQIHKLIHSLDALALPAEINQVWSMDFMSDSLKDGRSIRTFNVIDDCNRESLAMDFGISLPAKRIIRRCNKSLNGGANRWFYDVITVL
tara:strand:+ start:206 stop:484 length:279 start_codon:yes stop_codon:yes gene_type:complete